MSKMPPAAVKECAAGHSAQVTGQDQTRSASLAYRAVRKENSVRAGHALAGDSFL